MASGTLCLVFGYLILASSDPGGRNAASVASPVLLVLGYGLIGFGTIARERP